MQTEHCEQSHVGADKPHELAENLWSVRNYPLYQEGPITPVPVTAGHPKALSTIEEALNVKTI